MYEKNDFQKIGDSKLLLERRKKLEAAIINDELIIANALDRIRQTKAELAKIVSRETKK